MNFQLVDKELENMTMEQRLHYIRNKFEPNVYETLVKKYGEFFNTYWEQATWAKKAPNTVMLVERRKHPNIEFVLQNHMYFAQKSQKEFSLTIVCSDYNLDYVKGVLGKHVEYTTILPLFKGDCERELAIQQYNTLFKSKSFWSLIQADYILSIQTDSYLLRPLENSMWNYDYIACCWSWHPHLVGGGGLTWRKRTCVLDICKRMKTNINEAEDIFFSKGCNRLKKKVPSRENAERYFIESYVDVNNPIGVHQWWTYLIPSKQIDEIKNKVIDNYLTLHL